MSDNYNLDELLNELGSEPTPEVDWNAPESGEFPPAVKPGVYEFVFKLRDDQPFDKVAIEGTNYLQVIFDAEILGVTADDNKTITYQRVNTFKHNKVPLSGAAELARALAIRPDGYTSADWVAVFQGASGRARGKAEVAWRLYDKAADVTYSTSPRKRKNAAKVKVKDQPWPRNADGSFADTVTDSTGRKRYGQAELIRFFTPEGASAANGD